MVKTEKGHRNGVFYYAMRTKTQFSIDRNVIMLCNIGILQDNHIAFFHKI